MRQADARKYRQYRLKPCRACSGAARVEDVPGGLYWAICPVCGLRTDVRMTPREAAKLWNAAQRAGAARVLTLRELCEVTLDTLDDEGTAAVWVESRTDGALTAMLAQGGTDFGFPMLELMDQAGEWRRLSAEALRNYGRTWRAWCARPCREEIEGEKWDRPLYGPYELL